jgi:hypothetical protein
MGQYHIAVNIDKRQYIDPYRFGDGGKLLDFGPAGHGMMLGLCALLARDDGGGGGDFLAHNPLVGSWAGDRILIVGDYGRPGRDVTPEDIKAYQDQEHVSETPDLYEAACALFENVSDSIYAILCDYDNLKKHMRDPI